VVPDPHLEPRGWHPSTRRRLESLIRKGAGQGLPVAFDFDNTLVCGDIGEATLALLVRDGQICAEHLPPLLVPEFRAETGELVSVGNLPDLTSYYETYLAPTAHGGLDPTPLANGYVWAATAMQGLSVKTVAQATQRVFARARPGRVVSIEVTPGRTAYPVPFFYPEMVDLLGLLLRHDFDVWVVSASNVWSVRWMVLNALNPLLRAQGVRKSLPADHVIGVSTLLTDRQQRFYKDSVLVRTDPAYARLEGRALGRLRLSGQLHFPAPVYSGKVAALWDVLGRPPFLAAGDSPGDLPMLSFARHRLWIARSNKTKYQAAMAVCRQETGNRAWLVQPTVTTSEPGFRSQ
jgi:hypothetical protein